jgi:hypothetical protein
MGTLPIPMQHVITVVLTRARDTESEAVPTTQMHLQEAVLSQPIVWGWLPLVTLISTLGLLSVAYVYTSSRNGAAQANAFFWLGLLLIFVPMVVRLISPAASRFERIGLLCVVGICFYLVKVMQNPLSFYYVDEFLHSRTADDITRSHHLFSVNVVLPVSPFYPGLEIVTNALQTMSGLSTYHAGLIVIGVARLVMILSLFMLCELMTKSTRVAGIATILYAADPHFLFFDAIFAYGSLALALGTFALFVLAHCEVLSSGHDWLIMLTTWAILGAAIVTHHTTIYFFDVLLILWAVIRSFQGHIPLSKSAIAATAIFGLVTSIVWLSFKGNPVVGYLSSYLIRWTERTYADSNRYQWYAAAFL